MSDLVAKDFDDIKIIDSELRKYGKFLTSDQIIEGRKEFGYDIIGTVLFLMSQDATMCLPYLGSVFFDE